MIKLFAKADYRATGLDERLQPVQLSGIEK
jgi:hypothetical protein